MYMSITKHVDGEVAFVKTTSKEYMVGDGFFYLTELVGPPQNPLEVDYELVWVKRSARYMLSGKDYTGETCEIHIENNADIHRKPENGVFRTSPRIITNSKALEFLNGDVLIGEGQSTESGIDIKIYRSL